MADDGLADIIRRLQALPKEILNKNGGPLRKTMAAVARIVRDDARRRVRVSTGDGPHLRDQIITYRNRDAGNGVAEHYMVTVRYKARKYKNNKGNRRLGRVGLKRADFGGFYYWRFLEFGTSHAPAIPFLRPAFEANRQAMLATFESSMAKAIDQAVRKFSK